MDDDLKNLARSHLEQFSESIDETRNNFDQLDVFGRYSARRPIILKYLTMFTIDSLDADGTESTNFSIEFRKIERELESLRDEYSIDYTRKLNTELQHLIKNYPSVISRFMELEPYDLEFANDLDIRDSIEILLIELDYEGISCEERIAVNALDEVYKREFEKHLKSFVQGPLEPDEIISIAEKPYYPRRFWWRHPSEHDEWSEWEL